MGKISIIGDVTGKKYTLQENSDHVVEIYDQQQGKPSNINVDHVLFNGTDILSYDSTNDRLVSSKDIYSSAIDASLGSHASSHVYGGADAIPDNGLRFSQIDKVFGSVQSVSVSAGGTYTVPKDIYYVILGSGSSVQVYNSTTGSWENLAGNGLIISDGSNVRIYNSSTAAQTCYLIPIL